MGSFAEADEVRLAYVAMTRTTERLLLTYHRESGFAKRLLAASAKATPHALDTKIELVRRDSMLTR